MIVGGIMPSRMLRAQITASTPPAAPRRCPVIDFVELSASRRAWSPKTALMAWVSARSPSGVLVAGTCVVPGEGFTLQTGDAMRISVGAITLKNSVA